MVSTKIRNYCFIRLSIEAGEPLSDVMSKTYFIMRISPMVIMI
jgi:hypothetical protein